MVDANGSVDVTAKDECGTYTLTVWSCRNLALAADLFGQYDVWALSYGENEYGSTLAAEIVNSTVTAATGDVSVRALSNPRLVYRSRQRQRWYSVAGSRKIVSWKEKSAVDFAGATPARSLRIPSSNTVAARIDNSSSLAVTAGTP